jgi:hypothetical protein
MFSIKLIFSSPENNAFLFLNLYKILHKKSCPFEKNEHCSFCETTCILKSSPKNGWTTYLDPEKKHNCENNLSGVLCYLMCLAICLLEKIDQEARKQDRTRNNYVELCFENVFFKRTEPENQIEQIILIETSRP